ncbi:MAG: phage holin family protein [Richelia sp. RM2_1_2]|nr:phage holin family protein [Richelia sp. SM2_1_7]NJM20527.1 phage holin family protein [Richelia sp. SM1_7_0]NJN08247.1 phage holin family protein [Richelia sp. RM1_1_1]NJO31631.1 phage holin family protein [Richelia sp. SL_2_1]NJO61107.1 phage holin family protein [Richelia sp. RM2_1_2]
MWIVNFLLTWLLSAISLLVTAYFVPGFEFDTFGTAAIAALILGLVNAIVRPFLVILTLPLTIVTLGLFLFVINALMFLLVGFLVPGFVVTGLLPAILASIVLTIVSTLLGLLVRNVT